MARLMQNVTHCVFLAVICALSFFGDSVTASPRFAPVVIDKQCPTSVEIDFNGLAYFCYKDPVKGFQVYRSNGDRRNWEPVTDFDAGSVTRLRIDFSTDNALYFSAILNGKWHLFLTTGRAGSTVDLGEYELGETPISYIASEGSTHFFRTGNSLYAVSGRAGSVREIAATTRDGGLYYSDVAYLNGYLYYVSSTSPGYWNTLERVDPNGNRTLLREFPRGTDTVIYPVVTGSGFLILNYGGDTSYYAVSANGVISQLSFTGEPIGKVGPTMILRDTDGALYTSRSLNSFSPLQRDWFISTFTRSLELDGVTVVCCESGTYLVSDATPLGTFSAEGRPLFTTANPSIGLLISRNENELLFLDKTRPQNPSKIAQFEQKITHAFARDARSYYVITRDDEHSLNRLWRVSRDPVAKSLLTEYRGYTEFANTEGQRLYFSATSTFDGTAQLWHSDGTIEFTYVLQNPALTLPSLNWLPAIHLLLEESQ